jgi:hypothetical protein
MKQRLLKRAQERICRRLRARFTMVKPEPVQGMFNFRCHENCVEYVRLHPEENLALVETIYIDGGEPILHYLVHDPAAGRYLEVTLGWRAEHLEYYVVRPLHPDDLRYILSEFQRSLNDWTEEYVGWFGRKVLGIKRVL